MQEKVRLVTLKVINVEDTNIDVKYFKKMWKALEGGNYGDASDEMLDSRWAAQTPERAVRHARVIRWGSLEDAYGGLV